jgi:hypothetical protein
VLADLLVAPILDAFVVLPVVLVFELCTELVFVILGVVVLLVGSQTVASNAPVDLPFLTAIFNFSLVGALVFAVSFAAGITLTSYRSPSVSG